MKSFIVKLTALSLGLAFAGWLVFSLFIPEYYLNVMPVALIFFYVVAILVHAYQLKLAKKDMAKFARSNMLITFFKLLVYSVFAVVCIVIDKENAIPFVICLMALYLVFTFLEVSQLTKVARTGKG